MITTLLFIPAKDEEASIARVIDECKEILSRDRELDLSILVVDDGSTDRTSDYARTSGATVIRHEKNEGLGTAFKKAVDYALDNNFDLLITIDADGQFSPQDIPKIYRPVLEGTAHVTTGSRFLPKSNVIGMPLVKRVGNHAMAALISSIVGKKYRDVSCGFRAYGQEAILRLNLSGGFTYTQEVFLNLSHKGMKIEEIPINVEYFSSRTSRIAKNLSRYSYQTLKIIFKSVTYYRPLRFFGAFTILLWSISIPTAIAIALRYAFTGFITPYKGIGIVAVSFITLGFASFATGIILQIVSRLQMTAEDILYHVKRQQK